MYDHSRKAGNPGDVVKHVALVAVLRHLFADRLRRPYRYADAFAGYASNVLTEDGEWETGIGHLQGRPRPANDDVDLWYRFWWTDLPLLASSYPGSSALALRLAAHQGARISMDLWDTSPAVIGQLMSTFSGLDVRIHPRSTLPAELASADFVLVDPPGVYSNRSRDYPILKTILEFGATGRAALVWLPLTAQGKQGTPEAARSQQWRNQAAQQGFRWSTVRWTRRAGFCGCHLLYRVPDAWAQALRAAVEAVVGATDWGLKQVAHSSP